MGGGRTIPCCWRLQQSCPAFSELGRRIQPACNRSSILVGSERESKSAHSVRVSKTSTFWFPTRFRRPKPRNMPEIRTVRCGNGARRAGQGYVKPHSDPRPPSLESRTERGFPHSHSDGCCWVINGKMPNPAKITGPHSFLCRT